MKVGLVEKCTACVERFSTTDSENWIEDLAQHLKSFLSEEIPGEDDLITARLLNVSLAQKFPEKMKASIEGFVSASLESWCEAGDEDEEEVIQTFEPTFAVVRKFGWNKIYRASIQRSIDAFIESHVSEICEGEYQDCFLPELQTWLREKVLPWYLQLMDGTTEEANPADLKILTTSLMSALSRVRSAELFDIVADYPDSLPALRELREAMLHSSSQSSIGKQFRNVICKRLLHPGASTVQIVGVYVSLIRSLRVLDPSDILLTYVALPVRQYLMSRKDTVRCVVSSLIQGKDSDLHGELRKGGSLEYGVDEDCEEGGPGESWEPRKRNPELAEVGARGLDVLALLVSIYGSTDVFVTEYRLLLSERLQANTTYSTDAEVTALELLKMRFGEESLHSCEVMLRDVEESKRTNNSVTSALKAKTEDFEGVVDISILSDNYWPPLGDGGLSDTSQIKHHPAASDRLTEYMDSYSVLKKPRKLLLQPHLGSVDLDLDFDDGSTRHFSVNPVQASLILHLGDTSPAWSSELATLCGMEEEDVRKKMAYWVHKGVVVVRDAGGGEGQGVLYAVDEDQADRAVADEESGDEDAQPVDDSELLSAQSQVPDKGSLAVLEGYVRGILSNQDCMPLERIHHMLKLMVSGTAGGDNKFDMNMVELRRFLQSMVESDKIDFSGGVYCKTRR